MSPKEKMRVFYSWQSDLPDPVNAQLIRSALNEAATRLSEDDEKHLQVSVDEATRDAAGSPNIAETIFRKIRESDAFVCDVSKVAEKQNFAGELRVYCNPNVAIELGYAMRVLGMQRIVLVFNEGFGKVPDDLPFDLKGNRTAKFKCQGEFDGRGKLTQDGRTEVANAKGSLRALLIDALAAIQQQKPLRPAEAEEKAPEEIKERAT